MTHGIIMTRDIITTTWHDVNLTHDNFFFKIFKK